MLIKPIFKRIFNHISEDVLIIIGLLLVLILEALILWVYLM